MLRDYTPLHAVKESVLKDYKLLRLDSKRKLLRFQLIEAEQNLANKANCKAFFQHLSNMHFI